MHSWPWMQKIIDFLSLFIRIASVSTCICWTQCIKFLLVWYFNCFSLSSKSQKGFSFNEKRCSPICEHHFPLLSARTNNCEICYGCFKRHLAVIFGLDKNWVLEKLHGPFSLRVTNNPNNSSGWSREHFIFKSSFDYIVKTRKDLNDAFSFILWGSFQEL